MNKRIVGTVVLAIVVAMGTAGPAEAHGTAAKPDVNAQGVGLNSLSPADRAVQVAQEPLLRLNDQVHDVTSGQYDAQFAGAAVDAAHQSLTVYWAGKVPSSLAALRAQSTMSGVTLVIKPAMFSREQLMAAADEVKPSGGLTASIELAVDGSGITVAEGDLPSVVRGAKVASTAESALLQRIATVRGRTGIPVTITDGSAGQLQFAATREADISPFWAGAQILNPTCHLPDGSIGTCGCTSGFSMYASGSPTTRFTLTAAHCADFTDGVTITNGAKSVMGQSDFIHELYETGSPYDLGVVRLNAYQGESNAPAIYITDNSSDGSIPVSGYDSNGIPSGGTYCVHGMRTIGCNLYSGAQAEVCTTDGHCFWIIKFTSTNFNPIMCHGDSGGPIYHWTGSTVIASGIVSGGFSNDPNQDCFVYGGASVVASAVNKISGLRVVTTSAP
jgi:hypothetical protein